MLKLDMHTNLCVVRTSNLGGYYPASKGFVDGGSWPTTADCNPADRLRLATWRTGGCASSTLVQQACIATTNAELDAVAGPVQATILCFLTDSADVIAAACTCKAWRTLVDAHVFPNATRFRLARRSASLPDRLPWILHKFPNVEHLDASGFTGAWSATLLSQLLHWRLKVRSLGLAGKVGG